VSIDAILYARFFESVYEDYVDMVKFLLLSPLLAWQFAHLEGFNDHTHFHRCMLYIGRNPLHDVPGSKFEKN